MALAELAKMRYFGFTNDQHKLILAALDDHRSAVPGDYNHEEAINELVGLLSKKEPEGEPDPILLSIDAVNKLLAQAQEIIRERLTTP
jgi:hypothetical protein